MDKTNEITSECFIALSQLRELDGGSIAPQAVHARLKGFIESLRARAREQGLSGREADDIAYAVVALGDEVAMGKPEPLRGYWMSQPLQLVLFNQYTAGEHFFNRLRALLGEGRADAIAAYQLCLALGFRGQFGTGGDPAALAGFGQAALQQVSRVLPRTDKLGPHAVPADRAQQVRSSNAPLIAFAAGGLLIAFGVLFGLERLVKRDVDKSLEMLPQGALVQPAGAASR